MNSKVSVLYRNLYQILWEILYNIEVLNYLMLYSCSVILSIADTTAKVQTMAHIFNDSILLYDSTLENNVF